MAFTVFDKNHEKVLQEVARKVIFNIKRELNIGKHKASGKLLDSWEFAVEENKIRIFSRQKYAGALDFGSRPAQRASKDEENSIITNIETWMMQKGIRPRIYKKRGMSTYAPNASAGYLRAAAYKIAENIRERGLEGVNYSNYVMDDMLTKVTDEVGASYLNSIERTLTNNIKRMVGTGRSKF